MKSGPIEVNNTTYSPRQILRAVIFSLAGVAIIFKYFVFKPDVHKEHLEFERAAVAGCYFDVMDGQLRVKALEDFHILQLDLCTPYEKEPFLSSNEIVFPGATIGLMDVNESFEYEALYAYIIHAYVGDPYKVLVKLEFEQSDAGLQVVQPPISVRAINIDND